MPKGVRIGSILGKQFGKLTVIEEFKEEINGKVISFCLCQCSCRDKTVVKIRRDALTQNRSKSCGCSNRIYAQDFIGKKFGKLTITNFERRLINNINVPFVKCLCDCGSEKWIDFASVKNGNTKSCGCLLISSSRIGEKFKKLTIINQYLEKSGTTRETFVDCICDCGNIKKRIKLQNILSGGTTSCGCRGSNIWTKDLVGKKFNKLTVVERLPKYKKRFTYYRCVCDCGNETIVNGSLLQNGSVKSCGCLKKTKPYGYRPHNYKGDVYKNNIPLYDTYAQQLFPYEETRRDPENLEILQVRCQYCNKWMNPKRSNVRNRISSATLGNIEGEGRFYCSENCKKSCSIFGKNKYQEGYAPATSREVQKELRIMAFERDEYTCQKCGTNNNLHAHHIEGLNINPIESADINLVITLCADCHKYVHLQDGCKYFDLRCKKDKN